MRQMYLHASPSIKRKRKYYKTDDPVNISDAIEIIHGINII